MNASFQNKGPKAKSLLNSTIQLNILNDLIAPGKEKLQKK